MLTEKDVELLKSSYDELKNIVLSMNKRLLVAEDRYKAAEIVLEKIKSTTSEEIQKAYKSGYTRAISDMQSSGGGFTVSNESTKSNSNENVKKLVLQNN